MPKSRARASEIDRLEELVTEFTQSAKDIVESDHKKVDVMYDFLFVGKPDENPPVLPFVALMQRNTEDIVSFKKFTTKLSWILISILASGVGVFLVTVYNHVFLSGVANTLLGK